MVTFYHVSDVHLGASPDEGFPWSKKRREEIWENFEKLLRRADEEKVDLLLLAGDLFHRQPLKGELKEVNYVFSAMKHTRVVLIAGNHDYLKRDSCYREFPWSENVYFLGGRTCEKCVFADLHTTVYGLSYHSREIAEPLYDELTPQEDGNFSVLLAHGGDASHIPLDKKKLAASGFDYIALGHIHKPAELLKNRMAYAGALEPLDKNDLGPHGFISGRYERGSVETRFIPWAVREYIALEFPADRDSSDAGVREAIREKIRTLGEQNLYKIRLTGFRDPDICFETKRYGSLGQIVEALDETRPYYDLERLKQVHGEDLVGRYIRSFEDKPGKDEKRALYLGLWALLEGGRNV